jgi:hypothetical protein
VIFALTMVTLMIFAALAFDTGSMLLERRDQQNAADAAALAGARYLPGDQAGAEAAARSVAQANGFENGVDTETVDVTFPGSSRIEVEIGSARQSIFGGILGRADWAVAARAVAVNQTGVPADFSMLSLDPHGCEALHVSGNGTVTANGNIQVNSDCATGALKRTGGGVITVTADGAACNVVGDIHSTGGGSLNCDDNEGAPEIPDPLVDLEAPGIPSFPDPPLQVGGAPGDIPAGCPGALAPAVPATADAPATCQFQSSYAGTTWRLYPGYYPGGIKLQAGIFYLEPGIYYIGGGGIEITGNGATALSVAAGGTTLGGGILFYNTEASEFSSQCAANTAPDPLTQCIQPITLNGAQATIDLWPLDTGSIWDGLVVFQDRNLNAPGDDLVVNGSSSDTQVRGTIYLPSGDVRVNGSGGKVTVDQVISYRFTINGAPGSQISVLYDDDFLYGGTAYGLIE